MLNNNERISIVTLLQNDLSWLAETWLQNIHRMMKLRLVQIFQEPYLIECRLDKFLLTVVVFEQMLDELDLEFWVLLFDDTEHISAEAGKGIVVSRLDRRCALSIIHKTDFSEVVTFAKNPNSNLLSPIMLSNIDQAVSSRYEIH